MMKSTNRDLCLLAVLELDFSTLFFFLSSASLRFLSTERLRLLVRLRLLDFVLLLLLFVEVAGLRVEKTRYIFYN